MNGVIYFKQRIPGAKSKTGYDPRYHTYEDCGVFLRSLRKRSDPLMSDVPPKEYKLCNFCLLRTERLRCL